MSRQNCRRCGGTIDIAIVVPMGERVALEVQQEPIPPRGAKAQYYRIIGLNPLKVEPVPDTAVGTYLAAHDFECQG